MVKSRKPFIDKKRATTYSLVYRATQDADEAPERVLVDAEERGLGGEELGTAERAAASTARQGSRYPPGHPLAWLEQEAAGVAMSKEKRRELVELGFPDDGYDYLGHMRSMRQMEASLEASAAGAAGAAAEGGEEEGAEVVGGPSAFVPAPQAEAPEEDVRVIDASALRLLQQAEGEEAAAGLMGGVTAFSKERMRVHGLGARELADLEAAMKELEDAESVGDADGEGDLLDDFVLQATGGPAAEGEWGSEDEGSEGESVLADSEEEEGSEEWGGGEGAAAVGGSAAGSAGRPPARPGSIASTYWRDERTDRRNLLTVIDERFEHLAAEYDEDEIGDLDEAPEAIQGFAQVGEFEGLLDEFLEAHPPQEAQQAQQERGSQIAAQLEAFGFDDADAAVAVQKAHEAVQRAEAEEAGAAGPRGGGQMESKWVEQDFRQRERWDCQSVLSLRSNLDNHPGRLAEDGGGGGGSRRQRRSSGSEAGTAMDARDEGGFVSLIDSSGGGRGGWGFLEGEGDSWMTSAGVIRGAGAAAVAAAAAGNGGLPTYVQVDRKTRMPLLGLARAFEGVGQAPKEEEEEGASSSGGSGGEGSSSDEEGAGGAVGGGRPRRGHRGESAEDKRARKAAVKEAKRGARASKKEKRQQHRQASVSKQRAVATLPPQAVVRLPS